MVPPDKVKILVANTGSMRFKAARDDGQIESARAAADSLCSRTSVAEALAQTGWRAADQLRNLEFIAHILNNVEEMPLLQQWTGEHVMDSVDDEHFYIDSHEHPKRFMLQIFDARRWSKRRKHPT